MRRWLALCVTGALAAAGAGAANEDSPREFTTEHGGVRLRFVEAGSPDGALILLVHGYWDSVEVTWASTGVLDALAQDARVIALDCRGHGASDKPHDPAQYGMEMVHDLARVLDAAGAPRAHVVGHSMGAHLAIKFAATYPDRTMSVTLIGAGAAPAGNDPRLLDSVADALETGPSLRPLIEFIWPDGAPRPTDDEVNAIDADAFATNDPFALAAVARGYHSLTLTASEAAVMRVPVQAVVGTLDPMLLDAERLARAVAGMTIVRIDGADHIDAVGRPESLEAIWRATGVGTARRK